MILLFDATNFSVYGEQITPPWLHVFGSITIIPVQGEDLTDGIHLNSINLPIEGAIAYSYRPAYDLLIVGSIGPETMSADGVGAGTNDFALVVDHVFTNPHFLDFVYAQQSTPGSIFDSITGVATDPPFLGSVNFVSVSEPGTVALFLIAVLMIAALRRYV